MAKTRVICTIGPSSQDAVLLRRMMLAGMSVARLNFSHGALRQHQQRLDLIRSLNKRYRRNTEILQDLEGYRLRIGALQGGKPAQLKKRQIILLTNRNVAAGDNIIPFDYKGPLSDIKAGSRIYIDDGNIVLLVKRRLGHYLKAEVVIGGLLKEHKGINIPDTKLKFKGLTDKDKKDLDFGIKNKVEYIAQSFVRDKQDILSLRKFIGDRLPCCKIIAKIENRPGIKNIDEILDVCEGVMVARGDMGVSLPVYEIPVIQKMIIKKCNQRRKLVITATQMLESMTENLIPERSEVSDVANAVLDGSDFVMLSAETAVGKHPAETVKMMQQIIRFTERFSGSK
ncbi:MAG: pyruvate kinase [Candidatus Omnitrophica bacterium]|nr:pyruvate kinase [Candidatus Omnitrophota bacterium]